MLVGAVACVDGVVLDGLALLEQPLAAAEVADERPRLAVPRHVAVDVRPGEVLGPRHAEGVGRAGERVPDEVVDARRERAVARVLEAAGIDGPVADHVGEGFGGGARPAVEVRGGDGGAHVVARLVALAVRVGPELALRHVVHAEEGELVGLAEDGGRALPRPARLGDKAPGGGGCGGWRRSGPGRCSGARGSCCGRRPRWGTASARGAWGRAPWGISASRRTVGGSRGPA